MLLPGHLRMAKSKNQEEVINSTPKPFLSVRFYKEEE